MNEAFVCEIPGALEILHARYFAPQPSPKRSAKTESAKAAPLLNDDTALIRKASAAKNGNKFRALMGGELSGHASHSEADLALCSILSFWTQNPAQIDRIFRQSGLFREKWDQRHYAEGSTYGAATIQKALAVAQSTYPETDQAAAANKGTDADDPDSLAKSRGIRIQGGELPRVASECQTALLAAGSPIYQRVSSLVRPLVIEKPKSEMGNQIPAGTLVLEPITESWLAHEATKAAQFVKFDKRSHTWERVDCQPRIAKTLLELSGQWRFPLLAGIIEAPSLRPDGSLLDTPGYDPATALYLHLPNNLKVKIRQHPTRDDALKALKAFSDLLIDFPFAGLEDCSVAIAAILTALIRRLLRTAPGFLFTAPTASSGKTLLADVVAMIATGRPASIMSQGSNDEEMEKRLGALLLQGVPLLNIDNIERPLGGELLCSVLTSPEVTIRILGESRSPNLPTNFLFMATGNNAGVKGDLRRRILPCSLDPNCENPEKRRFDHDLYEYVPAHRGELIAAGLTILRSRNKIKLPKSW